MWGQLATWPDLSFAVSLLARFQTNPGLDHWNTLMHVIGYIKNTIDYGITYSRDMDLSPIAYVDADYGGCKDTWRSTSGYIFTMAGGLVTWSSKRQATVALSTVEAEYVAMSRCTQQMVWMQNWLSGAKIEYTLPGVMKGNNRGAIALTKNMKDHGKVKHIDIRHHYLRELVQSGTIIVEQVPSTDNLADIFTKPLPHNLHHRLLATLNIYWALIHSWGSIGVCPEQTPIGVYSPVPMCYSFIVTIFFTSFYSFSCTPIATTIYSLSWMWTSLSRFYNLDWE